MATTLYYEIRKYCDVLPNYALAFSFAKNKKCFEYVFPYYKEDVLQIIAMCVLESKGDIKKMNRLLGREIYHYYNHVVVSYKLKNKKQQTKKNRKDQPDYNNHCDVCGVDTKEYMYKSLYPGKTVCRRCYRRHKREYRNKKLGKE